MAKNRSLAHYKDHVLWWGGYSNRQKRTSDYFSAMFSMWLRVSAKDPSKLIDPMEFCDFYYCWQRDYVLAEIAKIPRRRWPFKETLMNHQAQLLKLRLLRNRYRGIIKENQIG